MRIREARRPRTLPTGSWWQHRMIPPTHVDDPSARLVAEAFLAARSAPDGALVAAAYGCLAVQARWWFAQLTCEAAPWAVKVHFTACAQPYSSAGELATAVREHRTLEMPAAKYDRDRPHPALDTSIGGDYDRFRSVHDVVSHGWLGLGFDRDGEFQAWRTEHAMYRGLARRALATELHAEHSVLWTSGTRAEHKAVLLDTRLIRRSWRGDATAAGRSTATRQTDAHVRRRQLAP